MSPNWCIQDGHAAVSTYDGLMRLTHFAYRAPSGARTATAWSYSYNTRDLVVAATHPGGRRYHYRYDDLGRLSDAEGVGANGVPSARLSDAVPVRLRRQPD